MMSIYIVWRDMTETVLLGSLMTQVIYCVYNNVSLEVTSKKELDFHKIYTIIVLSGLYKHTRLLYSSLQVQCWVSSPQYITNIQRLYS